MLLFSYWREYSAFINNPTYILKKKGATKKAPSLNFLKATVFLELGWLKYYLTAKWKAKGKLTLCLQANSFALWLRLVSWCDEISSCGLYLASSALNWTKVTRNETLFSLVRMTSFFPMGGNVVCDICCTRAKLSRKNVTAWLTQCSQWSASWHEQWLWCVTSEM